MIIVFVLYVLVFNDIVIGSGHSNQPVKRLYDKQCGEETDVLLEIEKHTFPGNSQAPLQILK